MILPPASILWDPGSLPRAPSEFKLSRWVNFSCTLRAATSICYSTAQVVWKTSGWPLSFRPWLPDSCLGYHSFLPASFSMIKCSCAHIWCLSVHVHFAEDLWPIKTVITYTFSLARFVRMLNQSNHSFHMYSTVLFMHLFLLTVLQKPPVVWTEVSVVVSRTLNGSGRCWFCWLRSKTAPWLIKNLALFSFALACVYKRSNNIRVNLPTIQPVFYQSVCTLIQSWPKAKQWQRERREVKDWDSVNTETKIWWPRPPSHIHSVNDLMATFLSGNNGNVI